MRVFRSSLIRCLSSPCRDISHGMTVGLRILRRPALRSGASAASCSRLAYSGALSLPATHAAVSAQAISLIPLCRVVEVLFLLADLEPDALRRRRGLARFHLLLEEHVHEQVHRLGLDDQRAGGPFGVGVEV